MIFVTLSTTMSQIIFFSLFHKVCDIVIDQRHQYPQILCHPSATQHDTTH